MAFSQGYQLKIKRKAEDSKENPNFEFEENGTCRYIITEKDEIIQKSLDSLRKNNELEIIFEEFFDKGKKYNLFRKINFQTEKFE